MTFELLFAHHEGAALCRCFRLGPVHLCARCSGLLPALLFGMAAQRISLPRPSRFDLAIELALFWPALWDYARGLRQPELGTNLSRAATGILLGLGLSRVAVLGRVRGFGQPASLFPIVLGVAWVLFARLFWPRAEPAAVQLTDGDRDGAEVVSRGREV